MRPGVAPTLPTALASCRPLAAPFLHCKSVALRRAAGAPDRPSQQQHWAPQRRAAVRAAGGSAASPAPVKTAKEAVETGLELFQAKDAEGALRLFQRAMELNPDEDEARAALYNAACAHTRLGQWQQATDAVVSAVNDYNLRLVVALRDDDLAALRERREWTQALSLMRGGISDTSYSQLRAEAKAPFRLTRIILLGGLAVGAGAGLLIITTRLIAALKGGEGAPDLNESLQNFGINLAALLALGFIVNRDLQSQKKDRQVIEREEALGQLEVTVSGDRVVPLAAFRGTARPVVVAGSRGQLQKALAASEPYYGVLRERGVCVVPVELSDDDPAERLRKLKQELQGSEAETGSARGFGSSSGSSSSSAAAKAASGSGDAASAASGSGSEGESKPAGAPSAVSKKDRRWKLDIANKQEWQKWAEAQQEAAGVKKGIDVIYAQVQLDGTVRASGVGTPPWAKFVDDLPELDSVRTKLTDGVGL